MSHQASEYTEAAKQRAQEAAEEARQKTEEAKQKAIAAKEADKQHGPKAVQVCFVCRYVLKVDSALQKTTMHVAAAPRDSRT